MSESRTEIIVLRVKIIPKWEAVLVCSTKLRQESRGTLETQNLFWPNLL